MPVGAEVLVSGHGIGNRLFRTFCTGKSCDFSDYADAHGASGGGVHVKPTTRGIGRFSTALLEAVEPAMVSQPDLTPLS